jgi:putative transposase
MNGHFRRRHLPHWDVEDAPYFITSCLEGSIPAAGMRELVEYSDQLKLRPRPRDISPEEWERRLHKLWFARMDELLDFEPAVRHFERADIAKIVMNSFAHFADVRYLSIAWVVMPSHIHWLFQPLPKFSETVPKGKSPREVIMHSLKSFTGNECNKALGLKGQFWQQESYDHWIRDDDELERVIAYILNNPVRAGLAAKPEDYRFSSAFVG